MLTATRPKLGGTARIFCIHDQEKRAVVELAFDIAETKVHLCACCENLFLERTDTPMFCPSCRRSATHTQMGPLPDPIGAVHG